MKYESNLINLEINRPFLTPITTKQNDTARYLLFNILDNGVPFNLVGKTVRAYVDNGTNPNYDNLTTIDAEKGLCELKLSTSMLSAYGDKSAELTITEGADTVSTMPFTLRVVKSIKNDNAIQATNEFSALAIALNEVEQWNTYFQNTSGQLEVKYTTRLTALEGEIRDTKATTLSTNVNLTSLPNVVDGLLNIDRIQGKTLVNLSKFTSLTTTDLKYYTNLLDNKLIQNRIVTIVNNTGRNIKVVVVNSTTGSFLREIPCNSQITNISTLGANESLSYFNGYKSDGWSEANKNDLLKVMVLDGTVDFIPNYFEGMKSVAEDNGNKIEILSIGKNLFNKDSITKGYYVSYVNGELGANNLFCASDFIRVIPNTQYYKNDTPQFAFYDINKRYISGMDKGTSFTTPSNCYYIRVTEPLANIDAFQIEKGTVETTYQPYKQDKSEILLSGPLCEWNWIDRVRNTINKGSIQITYDGSPDENWNVQQYTNLCAYITVPNLILGYTDSIRCINFKLYDKISNQSDGTRGIANEGTGPNMAGFFIGIKGLATDVDSWRIWLQGNPLTIVYRTATETTEPIASKLNLNSYANGYLTINSGAINPSVDVFYPTNVGERIKGLEDVSNKNVDDILTLFNKLKAILPSQIVEDTFHRFMTDSEKTKLSGIETNANNYTHPATHLANIINLSSGETVQAWVNKLQRTTYDNGDYILEKLPDGLILQASWHTILVSSSNVRTVTFQQAYPNKCIVIAVPLYKGNVEQIYVTNVTNTYFQAAAFNSSATNNSYFMWLAIGY